MGVYNMKIRTLTYIVFILLGTTLFLPQVHAYTYNVKIVGCNLFPKKSNVDCQSIGTQIFNKAVGDFADDVKGTLEFTKVKSDGDDFTVFWVRLWNITDVWGSRNYRQTGKGHLTDTGRGYNYGDEQRFD